MEVEVTTWNRFRRSGSVYMRAATIAIYFTAEEVQRYGLLSQSVVCGKDKYRLIRGLAFLRTHGLIELANSIALEVRRQEDQQQA